MAAIGAAALLSYVLQTPTYESSAGAALPSANGEDGFGLTLRGYQEFATSTPVMEEVTTQLQLAASPPQIRNLIDVQLDQRGRYITTSASGKTGQEAFLLANQWIQSYDQQIQAKIQDQFLELKIEASRKVARMLPELTQAEDTLASFDLENPIAIEDSRSSVMQKELAANEIQLRRLLVSPMPADTVTLAYLQGVLSNTPSAIGRGGSPGPAFLLFPSSSAEEGSSSEEFPNLIYLELRNCHEITRPLLHAQLYLMGDS